MNRLGHYVRGVEEIVQLHALQRLAVRDHREIVAALDVSVLCWAAKVENPACRYGAAALGALSAANGCEECAMSRTMCRYVVLLLADFTGAADAQYLKREIKRLGFAVDDGSLTTYLEDPEGLPKQTLRQRLCNAFNKALEDHGLPRLPRQLVSEAVCFDQIIRRRPKHSRDLATYESQLYADVATYKDWAVQIAPVNLVQALWLDLLGYLAATEVSELRGAEDDLSLAEDHVRLANDQRRMVALRETCLAVARLEATLERLSDKTGLTFGSTLLFLSVNAVVNVVQQHLPWERMNGGSGHSAILKAWDKSRPDAWWEDAPAIAKTPRILRNLLELAQNVGKQDLVLHYWKQLRDEHGWQLAKLRAAPLVCCACRVIEASERGDAAAAGGHWAPCEPDRCAGVQVMRATFEKKELQASSEKET